MQYEQRKILLIEPPFYSLFKDTYSLNNYPLCLGYLAGEIWKETNWSVMVYNSDFYPQSEVMKVSYLGGVGFDNYLNNLKDLSGKMWREIKSTIIEYKPTVVGISVKSPMFKSACIVARLAKEVNKQIIVIMGGPHPSMLGADLLNYSEIDICIKSEGEKTIVELLNAIENEKEFNSIQGIVYRKDGRIVENPPRKLIDDLDSLCFPHESAPEVLKDYDQYPLNAFKFIFTTRGCPYNCAYCGSNNIWRQKVRFRSPKNVIKEIKGLQKKGLRAIQFDDDIFGANKQYIHDLCNALIKYCPRLKWSCLFHVKLVDEQTISLMKKAGCYSIKIGIESGNNGILKKMRRTYTIEEAFSACKIIKKYSIELETYFMIGFPQETEDTLNDTVEAMKKINADVIIFSILTPYPGTEVFEFCKEKGLIDDEYDLSLHYHQSPVNCFCINITPERFRILAFKIEVVVDKINSLKRLKRVFSSHTLWRIKELGIWESLKKGIRIFLCK